MLVMFGILILIAITTKGYAFSIALLLTMLLYGLIIKIYLKPAKDLKSLEGISKY